MTYAAIATEALKFGGATFLTTFGARYIIDTDNVPEIIRLAAKVAAAATVLAAVGYAFGGVAVAATLGGLFGLFKAVCLDQEFERTQDNLVPLAKTALTTALFAAVSASFYTLLLGIPLDSYNASWVITSDGGIATILTPK